MANFSSATVVVSNEVSHAPAATALLSASATAGVALASQAGRLLGYGLREMTGTGTAAIRVRDGVGTSANPLGAGVTLAPNESVREWFGDAGIGSATGIYVDRLNGQTEVSIFWSGP